jgi:hypothetical protein
METKAVWKQTQMRRYVDVTRMQSKIIIGRCLIGPFKNLAMLEFHQFETAVTMKLAFTVNVCTTNSESPSRFLDKMFPIVLFIECLICNTI